MDKATYVDKVRTRFRNWYDALDEADLWDNRCTVHWSTATGLWAVTYNDNVNNVEVIEC